MADKFVVLKGIEHGNVFWTTNHDDVTKLADGTLAYEVVGYANSNEEAIAKCDGARGGSHAEE